MSKEIKDYLHLYPRCECVYDTTDKAGLAGVITPKIIEWGLYGDAYSTVRSVKPILRPLSDMTEEEAVDVYTIERDRILHSPTDDHDISRRADFGWVVTRLDHMNIGLLIRFDGVCYKVINEGKKPTIEPAMNQPLIFQYLLSKHFDLFGLIESGLAIDKSLTPSDKTNQL